MNDLDRLKHEYEDRGKRLAGSNIYSQFNPAYQFMIQQRQRNTVRLFRQLNIKNLGNSRILEIGCGSGGVIWEYSGFEAKPVIFFGVDLLSERLKEAHCKYPTCSFVNADGQYVPFVYDCFDMILQYTVFSSILDPDIKSWIAKEMIRIIKPGGWIFWYDFWLNPTNPQTRGIRPSEVRKLFPDCRYIFRKITLAPPIARLVVPVSWPLAYFLESLKVFNTHYLAAIQPLGKGQE